MIRKLAAIFLSVLLLGCDNSDIPRSDPGYVFFPLTTGNYSLYETTETRYAQVRPPEIRTYSIRETVGEKYTDSNGQEVYHIERASQFGSTWKVDSIWAAWQTPNQAIRIENGETFVKMEFPVRKFIQWDGNMFNSRGQQTYSIPNTVGVSKTIGNKKFDKTLTVIQQKDSTLLSLRLSQEIYAEGIGLIFKENTFLNYCGTPDCLGKGIIDYGYSKITTIKEFGK